MKKELGPELESLIGVIEGKDAKLSMMHARAATTNEPFCEVFLKLCEKSHIEATDDGLLGAVNWTSASYPTSTPTEEGGLPMPLKHDQLVKDLAALAAAGEQKKREKKKDMEALAASGMLVGGMKDLNGLLLGVRQPPVQGGEDQAGKV